MRCYVFGKKLRYLRKSFGLTQAQLAEKLSLSTSSIGMYEQGRREPDNVTLKKICSFFNTSTDYLLGVSDYCSNESDVDNIIDEFTNLLKTQKGLMFNGQPMTKSDREKIVTAIRIATAIVKDEKEKS